MCLRSPNGCRANSKIKVCRSGFSFEARGLPWSFPARMHTTGDFGNLGVVLGKLIMKDNVQQELGNGNFTVVLNKSELAEPVHEKTDSRTGGADHVCQSFLRNKRNQRLRLTRLAKFCHQQKNA